MRRVDVGGGDLPRAEPGELPLAAFRTEAKRAPGNLFPPSPQRGPPGLRSAFLTFGTRWHCRMMTRVEVGDGSAADQQIRWAALQALPLGHAGW